MKRLIPILVFILFAGSAFGQLPTTNLVAWYPICQDITDHSGLGYDLVGSNYTFTTDRFGNPNDALSFNGTSTVANYTTIFPATNDFSYSCWINLSGPQSSIVFFDGDPTLNGFGLVINSGTMGTPGTQLSMVWGGVGIVQPYLPFLTTGVWHHIVLIRFGNAYKMFIDNVANTTYIPGTPGVYNAPTNQFTLGFNNITGTDAFSGMIDDVATYDRALTNTEVSHIFNYNPDINFELQGTGFQPDTAVITCDFSTTLSSDSAAVYPTPAYNYMWNTGATTTTIPVTPVVSGGTYTLTVSRPYSCTHAETLAVRHIQVVVNLGPSDTTICHGVGGCVVLNGAGALPNETYTWNTGETTASISVGEGCDHSVTPYTYSLSVDSVYFTASVAHHCYGSDTIRVTLADSVRVDIGLDSILRCKGGDTLLQSAYAYIAPTYLWGGPAPVGGAATPTATATVTGTYWLQVTDGACKNADTLKLTILYDTLTLYNPDTAICRGQSVLPRTTGNAGITYQWTPTAGIPLPNVQTPIITPDTSAYYVVTGTIGDCHVRDSFFLDVHPYPVVFMGANRNVCEGDTLHIVPSITPSWYTHYIYDWSPGTNLDDSTRAYTVMNAGTDSTHLVLIVTTPGPAKCRGGDSIEIYWHRGNFLNPIGDTTVCPKTTFQLDYTARVDNDPNVPPNREFVVPTFVTHPSTYLDDSTQSKPWISPITNTEYTVIAKSQYNCTDTQTFTVSVHPNAVIYLGDSVLLRPGDSVQISPQTNCTSFSWFPPDGLNDTVISNPTAKPTVSITYVVWARTENNCSVLDSLPVHVTPFTLVDLPNAFTPGAGINNYFSIIKKGAANLRYFRIWDRWGNLVYTSTDIDGGWDGKYKGQDQPYGVYVYELEAISDRGKVFHKQGNVTLIR